MGLICAVALLAIDNRTIPELRRELGRLSNLNQSINCRHHMKDDIEIDHLFKFDAIRSDRDQVTDLKTLFKIHTNISNFEAGYPKP